MSLNSWSVCRARNGSIPDLRSQSARDGDERGDRFSLRPDWLDRLHGFPISLSLPIRRAPWRGEAVVTVDNLLPDTPGARRCVAGKTCVHGVDSFSQLEQIGRDCVHALQFLPDGLETGALSAIEGSP